MAAVRTRLVTRDHAYTSADVPWELDVVNDPRGTEQALGSRSGWRLFHYLSGGGLRAFGRSSAVAAVYRRQDRFWCCLGVLAVLWLVFWFV
ncbi:MAG: hypothetical protein ACI4Q3_00740 [Kiritimatiellia bacterium]